MEPPGAVPMMTPTVAVEDVQTILGYQFNNRELLLEAIKASGSGLNLGHNRSAMEGNKRLAQVGDAVMRLVLFDEWYLSGTKRSVGNEQVSRISSNANLFKCGERIKIGNYISTNPSQGDEPPAAGLIGTTLQALIGAVWYDSHKNLQDIRQIIQNLGLA